MSLFTNLRLSCAHFKLQTFHKLFCYRKSLFLPCVNFVSLSRSDTGVTKYTRGQCGVIIQVFNGNLNKQIQRFKTKKRRSKSSEKEDTDTSDDDDYDDDDADDDASLSDIEPDYEAPTVYKHSFVHSLRADYIIAKGLAISKSEADRLFYSSKFLYGGKTLLKKAKKLEIGDHIDVVHKEENDKLTVQRVKVIKVLNRVTRKGKPVVAVRIWRKPFEVDKQQS